MIACDKLKRRRITMVFMIERERFCFCLKFTFSSSFFFCFFLNKTKEWVNLFSAQLNLSNHQHWIIHSLPPFFTINAIESEFHNFTRNLFIDREILVYSCLPTNKNPLETINWCNCVICWKSNQFKPLISFAVFFPPNQFSAHGKQWWIGSDTRCIVLCESLDLVQLEIIVWTCWRAKKQNWICIMQKNKIVYLLLNMFSSRQNAFHDSTKRFVVIIVICFLLSEFETRGLPV